MRSTAVVNKRIKALWASFVPRLALLQIASTLVRVVGGDVKSLGLTAERWVVGRSVNAGGSAARAASPSVPLVLHIT